MGRLWTTSRQQAEQITCKECQQIGTVVIRRYKLRTREVQVDDHIEHLESCSSFKQEQPKHLRKKAWRGQEKRANALVGARETLMSGAVGEDGDGRAFHEWRVECKQTTKPHYTLTQTVWTKLVKGALRAGEEPVLHVEAEGRIRIVVRGDLWESVHGPVERIHITGHKTENTHRINGQRIAQVLVLLKPPGIEMHERDFEKLKEKLDEQRTGNTEGVAREA